MRVCVPVRVPCTRARPQCTRVHLCTQACTHTRAHVRVRIACTRLQIRNDTWSIQAAAELAAVTKDEEVAKAAELELDKRAEAQAPTMHKLKAVGDGAQFLGQRK